MVTLWERKRYSSLGFQKITGFLLKDPKGFSQNLGVHFSGGPYDQDYSDVGFMLGHRISGNLETTTLLPGG